MESSQILEKIKNALFKSKEDNSIEHVDMSYRSFINLVTKLRDVSIDEGYDRGYDDNYCEEDHV